MSFVNKMFVLVFSIHYQQKNHMVTIALIEYSTYWFVIPVTTGVKEKPCTYIFNKSNRKSLRSAFDHTSNNGRTEITYIFILFGPHRSREQLSSVVFFSLFTVHPARMVIVSTHSEPIFYAPFQFSVGGSEYGSHSLPITLVVGDGSGWWMVVVDGSKNIAIKTNNAPSLFNV